MNCRILKQISKYLSIALGECDNHYASEMSSFIVLREGKMRNNYDIDLGVEKKAHVNCELWPNKGNRAVLIVLV